MYSDQENKKAKIGKVSLDFNSNRYRLRWTYPKGNRNQIRLDCDWHEAIRIARIIDRDIELKDVDLTYSRYSSKHAQTIHIANKQPDLLDLWNTYKQLSKDRVSPTTIKRSWIPWEKNYLGKTPNRLLELDRATEFIAHLLTRYSPGSLDSYFSNCLMPSVNLAVKTGKIEINPYAAIPLPKKRKREIQAYEWKEIKLILDAFYSDRFVKPSSIYPHSYYAPMVEFLALTGCRPSECHALTWSDVKTKSDRRYIRFNKAYSVGILVPHTKTHEVRLFPINQQLENLLQAIPRIDNKNNLIFPSVALGYVNQRTFNRRYWKPIITGLVEHKQLDEPYRSYSLRHSFITRLIREGVDIATVARISGNSTDTIVSFYLASKDSFVVPEF